MRGPTYTIETALPRLYSLSLPAETLHAKFFFPEDGLENFLQFRMRVFVHTLMRAITHDFTHFTSLPAFPPPEHQKLRAWIEILMTHFVSSVAGFYRVADPWNPLLQRLVSRTLKHRTERISAGDLSWASYSFRVPAEAFQMFKLSIFLCNFVGFTTPSRFPDDLDFPILYPMIDLSTRELMLSGSQSDYPEYDSRGRLEPGSQLFAQASSVDGFSPNDFFSPSSFHTSPFPMGYTGTGFPPSSRARILSPLTAVPLLFFRLRASGGRSDVRFQSWAVYRCAARSGVLECFEFPAYGVLNYCFSWFIKLRCVLPWPRKGTMSLFDGFLF